ncbi:MAG: hypothetical protein NUV67_05695 [archaeon]|nr:hypothetical protein [archaeon]
MAEKKIQIVHLPSINEIDKQVMAGNIEHAYERLGIYIPGELVMEVHFKQSSSTGKRQLYEVHAHIRGIGKKFNAKFSDWDASKALNKTLAALEKEASKNKSKKN